MATVAQLRSKIQRAFGDESATFLEAADVLNYLNDGQLDIVRRTDCLFAETTATTTVGPVVTKYILPTDFLGMKQVSLNYNPLVEYPFEQQLQTNTLAAIDVPDGHYVIWNGYIYFQYNAVTAAVNYRLYYTRRPAALVNDTDIPEIPLQYHEDLVKYGLARAKEMEEDYNSASYYDRAYDQRINTIRSDVNNRSRQAFAAVRCLDNWDY